MPKSSRYQRTRVIFSFIFGKLISQGRLTLVFVKAEITVMFPPREENKRHLKYGSFS